MFRRIHSPARPVLFALAQVALAAAITACGPAEVDSPDSLIADAFSDSTLSDLTSAGSGQWYFLSDLKPISALGAWGPVEMNLSNGELSAGDGRTLTIQGRQYKKGIGTHADSEVRFYLGGVCSRFIAVVGVDDEVGDRGSVQFEVWGDGTRLASTGVMRGTDPGKFLLPSVAGKKEITLMARSGGDGVDSDHADWGGALVECASAPPPRPVDSLWAMRGIIIRKTDVTFTDPATGGARRVVAQMTASEEVGAREALLQTPELLSAWSRGMSRATMDIVTIDGPLTNVTLESGTRTFWVAPDDVAAILDRYAPAGKYDSIFVVWDDDGDSGSFTNLYAWGMSPSGASNNATWASLPSWFQGGSPSKFRGEAMVHEWLHGSHGYYAGLGLAVPDPHQNAEFGFLAPDAEGSWHHWYSALLSGTLYDPSLQRQVGYTAQVWATETPARGQ